MNQKTFFKNQKIFYMISIGWNLNEIRDLMKESKRIEKLFVNKIKYDNSHKIIDFKGINEYYCFKHECYHKKFRYTKREGNSIKVKTDSFENCKDNAYLLSNTEKFNKKFNKSIQRYSTKSHRLTIGSKKQ